MYVACGSTSGVIGEEGAPKCDLKKRLGIIINDSGSTSGVLGEKGKGRRYYSGYLSNKIFLIYFLSSVVMVRI